MINMKILIFGSKGWIGSQFINYLNHINNIYDNEPITIIETNVRADNELLVNDIVLAHTPSHIISFIGRTSGDGINSIDYLEQDGKLSENLKDNLYAPVVLAYIANKYKIHYTYIGTGCIFNQDCPQNRCYLDTDNPDFFGSSYSIVKGFTDRIMRLNQNTVLNLRIRMPISNSHHPRNFITKIINYPNICSMSNSMTVLPTMFPVIIYLMKNKINGSFNLVNNGLISHNEILQMYKKIVNPLLSWNNISIEEQDKLLLSKRSNCFLSSKKIHDIYPYPIPNINDAVLQCLEEIKNN
jgi:dTDP-4-dehydrorhamnose reductase